MITKFIKAQAASAVSFLLGKTQLEKPQQLQQSGTFKVINSEVSSFTVETTLVKPLEQKASAKIQISQEPLVSGQLNLNDKVFEQHSAETAAPWLLGAIPQYEGVDEKLLLSIVDQIPLLPEYKKTRKEYFFPMSIEEVWFAFFANEALYGFNVAQEELGDRVDFTGDWHFDPKKPTFEGLPYLQTRVQKLRTTVPPNPFQEYADAERRQYIREGRSKREIVIDEINVSSGFPYSESFKIHTRWEIYSPSEDAPQAILRHSWKLEWVEQPWIVSGLIARLAKQKVEENFGYFCEEYIPKSVEKFLKRPKTTPNTAPTKPEREINPTTTCTSATAHLEMQIQSLSRVMDEIRAENSTMKTRLFRMYCTLSGLFSVLIYFLVSNCKLRKQVKSLLTVQNVKNVNPNSLIAVDRDSEL